MVNSVWLARGRPDEDYLLDSVVVEAATTNVAAPGSLTKIRRLDDEATFSNEEMYQYKRVE